LTKGGAMLGVKVSVVRYISDEPQPGIVEFQLEDANGHRYLFVDKTAIVSTASLDAQTNYPQPGIIACEIVRRSRGTAQREVVRISTERPWFVESVDGLIEFDVPPDVLVEFNW
jgi:hypothetical protein